MILRTLYTLSITQGAPLKRRKTKGCFITLLCCNIVSSGLRINYIGPIVEMLNLVPLRRKENIIILSEGRHIERKVI